MCACADIYICICKCTRIYMHPYIRKCFARACIYIWDKEYTRSTSLWEESYSLLCSGIYCGEDAMKTWIYIYRNISTWQLLDISNYLYQQISLHSLLQYLFFADRCMHMQFKIYRTNDFRFWFGFHTNPILVVVYVIQCISAAVSFIVMFVRMRNLCNTF